MTKDELLLVLDMSEEEQVEFFYIKGYRQLVDTFPAGGLRIKYNENKEIISVKHSQSKLRLDERALADLAFRLRDEAKEIKEIKDDVILSLPWLRACYLIVNGKLDSSANVNGGEEAEYEILKRNPIDIIIAALIAKDKEND